MRNMVIDHIMVLDKSYTREILNTYSNNDLLNLLTDLFSDLLDSTHDRR